MAEHSYEIVVRLDGTGSGRLGKSEDTAVNVVSTREQMSEGLRAVKNNIAFKEITGIARQAVSFTVSNIGLTTGNSESQARAQFGMDMLGMAGTVAFSLATGNVLPAVLSLVHMGASTMFKAAQIELEQSIENESLALSRQRAGIAFNRSRTGGAS